MHLKKPSAKHQRVKIFFLHIFQFFFQSHPHGERCHLLKRYPEPVAHIPEARRPSHPHGRRQHRPAEGNPLPLIRWIWNLIPNH